MRKEPSAIVVGGLTILLSALAWCIWASYDLRKEKEKDEAARLQRSMEESKRWEEKWKLTHPSSEPQTVDPYTQSIIDRNKAWREIQKADGKLGLTNGLSKIYVP